MNYKFQHIKNVQNNEFVCVLFKFITLFNKRNSHNILKVQCYNCLNYSCAHYLNINVFENSHLIFCIHIFKINNMYSKIFFFFKPLFC